MAHRTTRTCISAAALLVACCFASAHTSKPHAAAAAEKKEQKAWGIAGDARAVKRAIEIRMSDQMRFTPSHIAVRQGETLRIVLKNDGKMQHEFVLGTKNELDAHAALMLKFPDMEHDEPYMAHVPAGKTASIVWTFNRAGDFDFACLIAGHYQAGMVGTVKVTALTDSKKERHVQPKP